jgi:hypothetical protein
VYSPWKWKTAQMYGSAAQDAPVSAVEADEYEMVEA